jgi:hypothetical protein
MLLAHRNILVDIIPKLIPDPLDFNLMLQAIAQAGIVNDVPAGASYNQVVSFVVGRAIEARWIRVMSTELLTRFPGRSDLKVVDDGLAAEDIVPTATEPFNEVLLEGDRPFVNRRPLRNALLRLVDPAGDRVLLVEGEPKSGKTFSYYLLNHAAPRRGFMVHKFDMSRAPGPRALAEDVLGRLLGIVPPLVDQGLESAERWAEKLSDSIATEVLRLATPRIFVFDSFPDMTLPPGTLSLISRIATYADQELQGVLRVVLVRFPGELPTDIDDVAARDEAQPFTSTDMVAAMMQIATARAWPITDTAMKAKIDEFERQKSHTLRERFRFLRGLVMTLSQAVKAAELQP